MNAKEVFNYLKSLSKTEVEGSCDNLKSGSWDKKIDKVAVTMMPTLDVIQQIIDWGADLIITHEPLFYDHMDNKIKEDPVVNLKANMIEVSGVSIIRFHDYMHRCEPDMINEGMLYYLGIRGVYNNATKRFFCDEKITPVELAKLIEERLNIKHVRICGSRDILCNKISTKFGAPMGIYEELRDDAVEIVLAGEVCEWQSGEYARDAALLGFKKSIIIMGHVGSERYGMKYLAKILSETFKSLNIKYFDSEELFSYTS